jgi:hypothetical protein
MESKKIDKKKEVENRICNKLRNKGFWGQRMDVFIAELDDIKRLGVVEEVIEYLKSKEKN